MPKYDKTKIYRLVCKDLDITDCYIGSTTNFSKRKSQHKCCCNNNNNQKKYQFIREHGGWNNWEMILIENYPCNNNLEARQRERYYQEFYNAQLNMKLAQTDSKDYHKEYYKINCNKLKEYQRKYFSEHTDNYKEYVKQNIDKYKKYRIDYQKKLIQQLYSYHLTVLLVFHSLLSQ